MKFRNLLKFITRNDKQTVYLAGSTHIVYINKLVTGYQYTWNEYYKLNISIETSLIRYDVSIVRDCSRNYEYLTYDKINSRFTILIINRRRYSKTTIRYYPTLYIANVNTHNNGYDYGWIELVNGKKEVCLFKNHKRITNFTNWPYPIKIERDFDELKSWSLKRLENHIFDL